MNFDRTWMKLCMCCLKRRKLIGLHLNEYIRQIRQENEKVNENWGFGKRDKSWKKILEFGEVYDLATVIIRF